MTRSHEIQDAIEVFVRGFCAGKSRTHPYEYQRIGDLWVMRDAPRKNPRDYRKEEWIAYGVNPRQVDRTARQYTRGRFFVCAIGDMDQPKEEVRDQYKAMGYRMLSSEPLFVHRLKRIPVAKSPAEIKQVQTRELAERFGKASRSKPIPEHDLTRDAPFRQYVALDEGQIVGWVRSVDAGKSTWCSNMYVRPSHRRRGIGKAMQAKMLRADRKLGFERSVLLSSHTGAMLYPHVGYEQIGLLLIFAPKRGA